MRINIPPILIQLCNDLKCVFFCIFSIHGILTFDVKGKFHEQVIDYPEKVSYPEKLHENERKLFVDHVQIVRESIQNVPNKMTVEKRHRRINDAVAHHLMDFDRGASTKLQDGVRLDQRQNGGRENQNGVQIERVVASSHRCLVRHRFVSFRRYIVASADVERLLLIVHPVNYTQFR